MESSLSSDAKVRTFIQRTLKEMAFEGKVISKLYQLQGALLSLEVTENIKALGVENEPLIILADVRHFPVFSIS